MFFSNPIFLTTLVCIFFISFFILSIYLYINRKEIMKKYDIEYISSGLLIMIVFQMPLGLIIKFSSYNSFKEAISSDPTIIEPLIGCSFWIIIGLIILICEKDYKIGIKYFVCKLFTRILITYSLGFFVIFKLFSFLFESSGYSKSYSNNFDKTILKNNFSTITCTFKDHNGIYRELGDNYYDGKGILRQYGDDFYDAKGILRKFGDDFYDTSGTLRQFGENFVDNSGYLRQYYKK